VYLQGKANEAFGEYAAKQAVRSVHFIGRADDEHQLLIEVTPGHRLVNLDAEYFMAYWPRLYLAWKPGEVSSVWSAGDGDYTISGTHDETP
jgi:hypothetical protein